MTRTTITMITIPISVAIYSGHADDRIFSMTKTDMYFLVIVFDDCMPSDCVHQTLYSRPDI